MHLLTWFPKQRQRSKSFMHTPTLSTQFDQNKRFVCVLGWVFSYKPFTSSPIFLFCFFYLVFERQCVLWLPRRDILCARNRSVCMSVLVVMITYLIPRSLNH